jgi:hypothetical protein
MPQKEVELVEQLLEKTRAKAIPWEPTARDNEFVAPFKGQVTFTVTKYDDPNYYGDSVRLIMRDPGNREMLMLDSRSGFSPLEKSLTALYQAAHDSALKVEETIDAILDDLKSAS